MRLAALLLGAAAAAAARVPAQLDTPEFAACLANGTTPIDLPSTRRVWQLSPADGLLLYLSLYAEKTRTPVQRRAFAKFSSGFDAQAGALARWLRDNNSSRLYPAEVFHAALRGGCGGQANGTAGFCAALCMHNVLRVLGRPGTFVNNKTGVDWRPGWWQADPAGWSQAAQAVVARLIPLRRDGGGDRWGEWYHCAGILAYGLHEAAVLGPAAGLRLSAFVAWMDRVLNPIFAGGTEDPVKARVDRDSAELAGRLVLREFPQQVTDCLTSKAYVYGNAATLES